jgi:membrane fusion protein, multidrug efflux system
VYVVTEDQTVAVRAVGVGAAQDDDLSIDSGLSPGEVVVVDGTEKLREGSKVEVRNQKGVPAKPTDAPVSPAGTDKPKRGASL